MLKGLALTPPVIGRISIGKIVEKNGMRLPEKDDEFTIHSQVQNRDGWINHPVDEQLRKGTNGKLRSIPVQLIFDDPDLNLRANYTLFDRKSGRPLCVGNGETCRRSTAEGLQTLPCPAPEGCELAAGGHCKPFGRLNVRIGEEDELGSFAFRTAGFNSIRTLSTRLMYFHAVSGGLLSTLPLELRLRGKSTTQSHRAPIYYVDLTVRGGSCLASAIATAAEAKAARAASGFDQAALEAAAKQGFSLGAFEESAEETGALLEEFYGEREGEEQSLEPIQPALSPGKAVLKDKLAQKASRLTQ